MKTVDIMNLHINADIFIIPNPASNISDFFDSVQNEQLANMSTICKLNNEEFTPGIDRLVETWMVCKELGCDNVADHRIEVLDLEGNKRVIGIDSRYLPSNLLEGHVEGDIINIKLPVYITDGGRRYQVPGITIETVADFTITLNQLGYHYRRFGFFEDVMAKVMR